MRISNHKTIKFLFLLSLLCVVLAQILLYRNNTPVLYTPITSWNSRYSLIDGNSWYIDSKYASEHNLMSDCESIEFIYGPFVPLAAGSYIVDISYISTSNQSFRPYAFENEDKILIENDCILESESTHKLCKINILENLDSFEIRVNYDGHGVLKVNDITIRNVKWLRFYVIRNIFLLFLFSIGIYLIIITKHPQSAASSRMMWLDYAKGICILFVLLGHTYDFPYHWFIYGFHMPFFFITAGYLFKSHSFIDQIRKVIKNYIIPYLLLCFANSILRIPYLLPDNKSLISILNRIKDYMIGSIKGRWLLMPNCMPLWFLIALAFSLLLFQLINYINNGYIQLTIIIALAVLGTSYNTLAYTYNIPKELPWGLNTVCTDITFIYIGYLLKKYKFTERITNTSYYIFYLILSGILGTFFITVNHLFFGDVDLYFNSYGSPILMYLGSVSMTLFVFMFTILLEKRNFNCTFLSFLGINSMFYFSFDYWGRSAAKNFPIFPLSSVWVIDFAEKILLISILFIFYNFFKSTILKKGDNMHIC